MGKRATKQLVEVCELIRLYVAERFLDENGMLRPLAELLDGHRPPGAESRGDLVPVLQRLAPELFADVLAVDAVPAPGRDRLAVCADVSEKGWFTSRVLHAGFLLGVRPRPRIVGDLALGTRGRHQWELVRTASLS